MNTDRTRATEAGLSGSRHGRIIIIVAAVIVVIAVSVSLAAWMLSSRPDDNDAGFAIAERGPLTISVSQKGIIKSRDKVVVKCRAEGRNAIISLIEEGKMVKKGDLLMELDASRFVDRRTRQEITVSNAQASFVRARETLAVTKNRAAADIDRAKLALKFAKLDLEKYTMGEYPQQLKKAETNITLATEELRRATDRVAGSRKLEKDGYITRTELQADLLAEKRSYLNLEMAKSKLNLLEKYTHKRNLEGLQSNVRQTIMALERTKRKASADILQAEVDLTAKDSQYKRQKAQLEKICQQIGYCRIVAPVAGQVVYATTGRRSWGRAVEPLAEGLEVRERQELFHLPTAEAMMTEIKIHESNLKKVKVGMPARITISSMPGKVFTGRLKKIAPMPDEPRWTSPNVRAFNAEIYLDSNGEKISPGVSCNVEIIVRQFADTLYVPLQAVVRVKNQPTVYVKTADGVEPRRVKQGMDNGRVVQILEGLVEGDKVLLTPPLADATAAQGQATTMPTSRPKPASRPATETGT